MGESDLNLDLCTFSDELASHFMGNGASCGERKLNLREVVNNKFVVQDRNLKVKRLVVDIVTQNFRGEI